MSLDWIIRRFADVAALDRYLATVKRPAWVTGLTTHHTWRPTVKEWRGQQSMLDLKTYYESLGWSAGPHLFIGTDGIWQGTPVDHWGVHAGPCNGYRLGIEVVGDYDASPWAEPIRSLALGAHAALLRWLGKTNMTDSLIVGHRDCMPNQKTCPGSAIDMGWVRREVAALLAAPQADRQVIGVTQQSATFDQVWRSMQRNKAQLSQDEAKRVYAMCEWLGLEASFLVAVWAREGGRPFGSVGPQPQSRCWINIKAAAGEWRDTVSYNGEKWLAYESYQLGGLASVLHLKQMHGAHGRLTVRQIAPAHLNSAVDDVAGFVRSVLEDMAYIERH